MVKINDRFSIDTDRYNFILLEYKKLTKSDIAKKKNKEKFNIGDFELVGTYFYPTIEVLFKAVLLKSAKKMKEKETIEEYIDRIEKIEQKLVRDVKKMTKEVKLDGKDIL